MRMTMTQSINNRGDVLRQRNSGTMTVLRDIKIIDFLVYGFIVLFLVFNFISDFRAELNALVQVQFLTIELLSIAFFISDKRSYSVHKFLMIYLFVFEGYAPLLQYRSGSNLWGIVLNTDELYLYSNVIVFIFLLVFEFGYRYLRYKKPGDAIGGFHNEKYPFSLTSGALLVFSLIDVLSLLYLGETGQLIGRAQTDSLVATDTIAVAAKVAVQTFCVASLLVYVLMRRCGRLTASELSQGLFKVVTVICVCLIFFPLWGSMSRFLLFAVYIMLAVMLYPSLKHPSLLLLAVFLGFVFIFPAFNFFKYHGFSDIAQFQLSSGNFDFVDFDAHQCLMITCDYAASKGYSWGMNLISAVLCFVPRAIWPAKWLPTGQVMFSDYGAAFTNVSCPMYAEFYLAFGIPGLIVFSLILGYVIRFVEESYERGSVFFQGVCIILIGMTIYIARGAMLPTFAYTFSVFIAFALAYFLARGLGRTRSVGEAV